MSIAVYLPPSIQNLTGGERRIAVEGITIGDCLEELVRRIPALNSVLYSNPGELNRQFSYFLNSESIILEITGHKVKDGDELFIVDILVGG